VDILNWLKKSDETPETEEFDLAGFTKQDVAVVFKHSETCPVSWMAKRQVDEFVRHHPEVPLRVVIVQKERQLSNRVAAETGIRHESPQVLVFRRGQVTEDASHAEVTSQFLTASTRPQ
jgi:bacillithiol system protein YtxJ